jgi:hypothetical protein
VQLDREGVESFIAQVLNNASRSQEYQQDRESANNRDGSFRQKKCSVEMLKRP